ncbi:hypothetical protein OV079_25200 [Nannocystis pusilla]|uniref:VCBS repeat-containing protein n=1 Tax=Nannocystis pusilla TaxID=889268 RepID=A0A9X3ER66_9BACT|nr:hypothetical protein [Nannocystis pusilla]MCY1008794.1 hypothetical protein [Nannocystis pusilla]
MAPPRSSAPRILGLAALGLLVGVACNEDPCGPHAWWCDPLDDGQWQLRTTPVDAAVLVDFDGDGEDEAVVLSRDGLKLTLARGTDLRAFRSSLELVERPWALAALPGEVAVALMHPPQIAIFGMDADGRLARRRDIPLSDAPSSLDAADLDGDGAPSSSSPSAVRRSSSSIPGPAPCASGRPARTRPTSRSATSTATAASTSSSSITSARRCRCCAARATAR